MTACWRGSGPNIALPDSHGAGLMRMPSRPRLRSVWLLSFARTLADAEALQAYKVAKANPTHTLQAKRAEA